MKNAVIKTVITFLLFIGLTVLINHSVNNILMKKTLEIEVAYPRQNDTWQVFYNLGHGYRESDSAVARVSKTDGTEKIAFDFYFMPIKALRIDPGNNPGDIFLKSVTFKVGRYSRVWSEGEIIRAFRPLHDISEFNSTENTSHIRSIGNDPYFEYAGDFGKVDGDMSRAYEFVRMLLYIFGLVLALGLFIFFEKLIGLAYFFGSLFTARIRALASAISSIKTKKHGADINLKLYVLMFTIFLFFIGAFVGNSIIDSQALTRSLLINIESPRHSDIWQVFYDVGRGYNEADSIRTQVYKKIGVEEVVFRLPRKKIYAIRIDPGTFSGDISIKSISIHWHSGDHVWSGHDIIKDFAPLNQISTFYEQEGATKIVSTGNDPYFAFTGGNNGPIKFIQPGKDHYNKALLFRSILLLLCAFAAAALYFSFYKVVDLCVKSRIWSFVKGNLDSIGGRINEEHLIKFDHKVFILLFVIFVLFGLSVGFKIHGSSIAIWENMLGSKGSNIVYGEPRGSRSDEWGVHTLLILSQAKRGFPVEDDNIGYGKAPLLTKLPAKNFYSIFRPQFYGFYVTKDLERAFSYYWNFKIFGLLIGAFFLMMLLTKSNFWLALFASFWVFLSSYIQWWFSTPEMLPETIMFFCLTFVSLAYLLLAKKKVSILSGAFVLYFSFVGFFLVFYPPTQIPLFYLFLFLLTGFILDRFADRKIFDEKVIIRSIVALLLLAAILATLGAFYFVTRDTIVRLLATNLGKRNAAGGGIGILRFFSGYYNAFSINDLDFPGNLAQNVCEASNFILLFPVIFAYAIYSFIKGKMKSINFQQIALLIYLVLISAWMIVGFLPIIARISLMSYVTPNRASIGVGLASIILTIVFINNDSGDNSGKRKFRSEMYLYWIIFLLFLIYGILLHSKDSFFTDGRVLLVTITMSFASYFF